MNAFVRFLLLSILLLAVIDDASAEAWIRLDGPPGNSYQAPAAFDLKVNWGATTTGPKAEYIDGLRLLRNGTVVTIQAGGVYREVGLSPGTYHYELRADAVRNLPDGDQTRRSLVSAVGPITVSAPPAPFDGAEFTGLQIPGPLQHRTPYTFSATVRNTGNTTWPAGYEYQLGGAHDSYAGSWSFANVPVPHPVGPGQSVTFNINVTAPPPGEYGFQLQMIRNGVGRFGAASGLATLWVNGPINKAHFIDQNVPSQMEAGKTYNVSLRMRNAGNTTWNSAAGYALGALNDSTVWGSHRLSLPGDIGPGATAVISAQVRAPTAPGVYNFQWQMVQDGVEWFGVYTTNVPVTVVAPPSVVTGNIDGLSSDGTALLGWACSTNRNDPIDVHLYARGAAGQGVFVASARADQASEPAIAAACTASGTHYRFTLPLSHAVRREQVGQPLYVHGISPVGGAHSLIGGSGTFRMPSAPVGSIVVNPNPCTIAWGQPTCSTTVQWLVSVGTAQLWSAVEAGTATLLAEGSGGSVALDTIPAEGMRLWIVSQGEAIAETRASAVAGVRPGQVLSRSEIAYDELGRIIARTDGAGNTSRSGYDGNGRVIERSSAGNEKTLLSYDALGRAISSKDASGAVTQIRYDAMDRVISVVDPRGLETSYERDGFGRPWRTVSPDAGSSTYQYQAPSRVVRSLRSDGVETIIQYDGLGRILSSSVAGDDRLWTYDNCANGIGRMCSAVNHASTVAMSYAPDGQLAERTEDFALPGIATATVQIGYDPAGRLSSIVYPDGTVAGYGYSGAWLSAMSLKVAGVVQGLVSDAQYNAGGRLAQLTMSNGLVYRNAFDAAGRLSRRDAYRMTDGVSLQDVSYHYDAVGRISSIEDMIDTQMTQSIAYDNSGRLASLARAGITHAMQYDANGNWMTYTDGQSLRQYIIDAGSNRLSGYQTDRPGDVDRTYGYDAAGSRISEDAPGDRRTYSYDGFNRLSGTVVNGVETQYFVNALGQRTSKMVSGAGATTLAFLGQNLLLADHDASGWSNYLWFNGDLIGVARNGQIYPVRTDHLGRPEFATDGSAQVVWKAYNYAYGRTVTQDQMGGIRLGLPGQYFDSESGLWYNGYRDYDPVIGRYLQSDPLGLAGGMNTYAYVSGNPISFVDPLGLTQCDIDAAFAFAKKMNPDIKFGAGAPKADIPRDGVEGKAELRGGDGYIHLNERYLNVLDWSGVYNLLDTMIHEGLHFTRPIGLQEMSNNYDHRYISPEATRRAREQVYDFNNERKSQCGCDQ
ncbi:RHS repeat-associated core domain-containing protein [Xanthomonas sp. 1678]|uniref:RHS repeat domain-containing protein n=1 Tax=Xanthomonas sp. 1678 TaxID=3158788 RepID=UPI00285F4602|nr:RHS repeat-associated protein [Xanthomonas translucens]